VEAVARPDVIVPEGKVIYLTFDDGPSDYTQKLLEVLKKYEVNASFFVVKTSRMDLLDDIVMDGHSIGIHSKSHRYEKIYANEDAYFEDLYTIQDLVAQYTGIKTMLMRFPGGSSNQVSMQYNDGIMTRLTKAVQDQGFQYFDWNVSPGDADTVETKEEVVENVIKGIQSNKKSYSVVLQHDIKDYSVDAVEEIIIWGLENGYTFLPLDMTSPTCHHYVKN
jgi:peptidoglycan/xylan/chitin deacetylase (PgdA/CDA1 family)